MKYIIFIFFLFSFKGYAQIKYPNSFRLIRGESPAHRDDYYSNGRYFIYGDTPFQSDGIPNSIVETKALLTSQYELQFTKTKDNLFVATGYIKKKYKYIVVVKGIAFILVSNYNDKGFSTYSGWLLKALRNEIKQGKEISFP